MMATFKAKALLHWTRQRIPIIRHGNWKLLKVLTVVLLFMSLVYLFSVLLVRSGGGSTHGCDWSYAEPEQGFPRAQNSVAKVSMIIGQRDETLYDRAIRTHEVHNSIHGYSLHVLRHDILDGVWSKPAYILSLLLDELSKPKRDRLQWLFWVDADTVVLNPHIPLETFLPPSPEFDDVHLVVTIDHAGLNNGVFPVRVNQWAVDLFTAILSFRFYRPNQKLRFRDQDAMKIILRDRKFSSHTVNMTEQRWFNAYRVKDNETTSAHHVHPGDFLVHFAGVHHRARTMVPWLDQVDQHLPEWEKQLQQTNYTSDLQQFWAQQRILRAREGVARDAPQS